MVGRMSNKMELSKLVNLLKLLLLSVISITLALVFATSAYAEKKLVVITQIVDHSSLNSNNKGIRDALKGRDIKIIFQNAQGNVAVQSQISKKFVSMNPDVMVGISTPSAQSLLATRKDAQIPVVFSAVTDPVSAKLVANFPKAGNNLTGASDYPPVEELIKIVKKITRAQKIGVIYSSSEANSVQTVSRIESSRGPLILLKVSVNNSAEVKQAAASLIDRVDAIILPSDNTVFSALEALINITNKTKIPVFSFDSDSVKRGVMLSIGFNQYDVGYNAGEKIAQILDGEDAGTIKITTPSKTELVINKKTQNRIGLLIPDAIYSKAKIVGN
jgi:putative tryptophan/tyrosine transport system substrate-binding protein